MGESTDIAEVPIHDGDCANYDYKSGEFECCGPACGNDDLCDVVSVECLSIEEIVRMGRTPLASCSYA